MSSADRASALGTTTATVPTVDDVDPAELSRVTAIALRRLMETWRLDNATAARLVAVSPRTWGRIKAGSWSGRLGQDQLLRASGLIGLYKALHLYFGEEIADRWPTLANDGPSFGGRTPVSVMLERGLPAILEVRAHVDALRGGA